MTKRMLVMLGIVIALVVALAWYKYSQIKTAMSQGGFTPPPEAVTTVVARQETWETTTKAIGTVEAARGVTVAADLPGLVDRISFESGQQVNKDDVLVRLDTKQEEAQLAAADAQRDLSRTQLSRARTMLANGIVAKEAADTVAAEYKQAEARVGEIHASIERKTIRAPFAGVLGLRQVNLGQYLAGGAPIVTLQALRPAYVNFTVPQQEMGGLKVGDAVHVTSDALAGTAEGRIGAFEPVIDPATRHVTIQAVFENRDAKLRPGMFVEAQLSRGARVSVIPIPASAIAYAPFGDSVFIVEDMTGPDKKRYRGVRQQFVKLGASRGDQVAVLSGVKPGEELVTSGVFKLRPNAAVKVNNTVQPGNNPAPKPEDG
jgi:membrane fusion protein (multidrug efflux system)